MPPPDLAEIYKLMRRFDDVCREAAQIRGDLAMVTSRRSAWPNPGGVSWPGKKSTIPTDLIPTSTVKRITN
jgi:hypothetical protein